MRFRILLILCTLIASSTLLTGRRPSEANTIDPGELPGLLATVELIQDSDGIPHIYAQNDHDAAFMLGWVQARDRFFQIDVARHQSAGTLAELLGPTALPSDIQFRTIGIDRAARESWDILSPRARETLQAFSDGINAYIADPSHPLPPEYGTLELTSVKPWTRWDALTVAKGVVFGLSFDLDIDLTLALDSFQTVGDSTGFDGTALFFEDLYRSAPFSPEVSIPASTPDSTFPASARPLGFPKVRETIHPHTMELARRLREQVRKIPALDKTVRLDRQQGSNWWVVSGEHSKSGYPLMANDPHLALNTPATFYEAHVVVSNDPNYGPMNVTGVLFPGTPSFALGCNERICWGSTVNPLDVTDLFEERLVINLSQQRPTHTVFEGVQEELVSIEQEYRVNQVGNGQPDDLVTADVGPTEGGITYLVPRRNMGPIIAIDISQLPPTGLSVQYAGARGTREPDAFLKWSRAADLADFKEGLQYFDVGSQNWAYTDVDGNIAYFTSAELPLREDLESGEVDGLPPYFIRSGTHEFQNEWIPLDSPPADQSLRFQILPFEEMPQIENPPRGFLINANNDPVGLTLDNDPLNQIRPAGGIYYLSPGYVSIRMARISRMMEEALAQGKIDLSTLQAMQADNRLLDAEVFVPYIAQALENAGTAGSPAKLSDLASDAGIVEAVNRLAAWDFTSPTGIIEGFDPGDDPDNLAPPSPVEIQHSVATTIYSLWRGQMVRRVIGDTLAGYGLESFQPDSIRSLSAVRNLLENFPAGQGIGASGINFFQVEGLTPTEARDFVVLESLRSALNLLAGDTFAPAYANSANQQDYRWGKLHRIVFDHPLGGSYSVPNAGPFQNLAPNLPGLARSGGFEVVDASGHSARASSLQSFMFGSGPSRRFVADVRPDGIQALQVIPGGQSGLPDDPHRIDQLGKWLTNDYHPVRISRQEVLAAAETTGFFGPDLYRLFFPFYEADATTFTGFAVSSLSESSLNLEWKAFDDQGSLLPLPSNPRTVELSPGIQTALLGSDIFQYPASESHSGWVELSATPIGVVPVIGPALGSFTQFGAFNLSRLDGGVAINEPALELVFTRVFEGESVFQGLPAATILNIANPDDEPTELELRLVRSRTVGTLGASRKAQADGPDLARTLTLAPKSVFSASASELFQVPITTSDAYVRVRTIQGSGAVGFELVRVDGTKTVFGLNAASAGGLSSLFSAQMASTPLISTSLRLINLADRSRDVELTAIGNDGQPLAATVDFVLDPGASLQEDIGELFGFDQQEGSLIVTSSGPGVIGDVVFGDPRKANFAAALPLQTSRFSEAVFSQVGNTDSLFTGLAFYNPNSEDVSVQVRVYSQEGLSVGEATLELGPGERVSRLLVQVVPESQGQQGGYIRVEATAPIIGQQLFGTYRLGLLSAVPPAVVE